MEHLEQMNNLTCYAYMHILYFGRKNDFGAVLLNMHMNYFRMLVTYS